MKDDSFDIPALKYAIVYNRIGSCLHRSINDKNIAAIPFEQVDGLTVRQFLNFFNAEDFAFCSYIEKTSITEKNNTDVDELLKLYFRKPSLEYQDLEISKYIESYLLNSREVENSRVNPNLLNDVICTFCQRYRGKDTEEMNNIRRLIMQKKSTSQKV